MAIFSNTSGPRQNYCAHMKRMGHGAWANGKSESPNAQNGINILARWLNKQLFYILWQDHRRWPRRLRLAWIVPILLFLFLRNTTLGSSSERVRGDVRRPKMSLLLVCCWLAGWLARSCALERTHCANVHLFFRSFELRLLVGLCCRRFTMCIYLWQFFCLFNWNNCGING